MSTKSKSRLGRGLSSLISVAELPVEIDVAAPSAPDSVEPTRPPPARGISQAEIPIDAIAPNPHQPRKRMDDGAIAELAASLKSTGLIQPIVVRRTESGYQLIAGERRLRAAKHAGLGSLPAIVRDVDSFTQAQMALVENIQREDLNPMDRALGYRALIDQLGLTQAELGTRLGEDRSSITNYLRLLDLAEPVREMVRDGRVSLGHAKLLAAVDPVEQQRLAELVIAQGLSVRNLERLVQGVDGKGAPPAPRSGSGTSAHLQDLEKSISRQLGMRTQVRARGKRGRIIIHYASLDQFDQLLERMGVKTD